MGVAILGDANATDPLPSNPYLEKDWAIYRGATLGMFDVSNDDTLASSGNITAGTSLGNLVEGGAAASVGSATGHFAPKVGGLITTLGAVNGGGYPYVLLPAGFNLAADVTRFMDILWVQLPAAGSIGASAILGILGSGTDGGADTQRILYLQANGSGTPLNLVYRLRGSAGNIDAAITGAALTAIRDAAVHQLAIGVTIAGGTASVEFYVDGVLVQSASGAATELQTPGGTPIFLGGPGVNFFITADTASLNYRLGRLSWHDLSDRSDISFADLMARDREGAILGGIVTS